MTSAVVARSMEEEIIVNDVGNSLGQVGGSDTEDGSHDDLPSALILTNVGEEVFDEPDEKAKFEALFEPYGEVNFVYFRSFHRVRVNFETSQSAATARIQLHQAHFGDRQVNCYFAQVSSPKSDDKGDGFLQPPTPVKQYLISPPASPPVGWEPSDEAAPIFNYDLITALANLSPGEPHELHPPSESQPGIVIHTCEAAGDDEQKIAKSVKGGKIPHTPRPSQKN